MPKKKLVKKPGSRTAQADGFAGRLKEIRMGLGISQKELAQKVGVSLTTIQNYEAGQFPKGEHLLSLASALSYSTDWLLTGVPQEGNAAAPSKEGAEEAGHPSYSCEPSARGRKVPIIGLAACGLSGWYNPGPLALSATFPVDHPYSGDLFAVIAVGTSMQPEGIRQGYLLFCDPGMPPASGDIVYVEKTDGTASIKTYNNRDNQWLHLQGWLAPHEDGSQKPYREQVNLEMVKRIACVFLIKRKA